jgi:hypothetical protein
MPNTEIKSMPFLVNSNINSTAISFEGLLDHLNSYAFNRTNKGGKIGGETFSQLFPKDEFCTEKQGKR